MSAHIDQEGHLNPLQVLIKERLEELEISQRAAAARSEGLLTAATINRILKGHHHLVTQRVVNGLSLALRLDPDIVAKAAAETALPAQWEEIAKQFGGLSPERQKKVLDTLASALEAEQKERRKRADAERPYRARRAR